MADLYRRNHSDTRTCKFCGEQGLKWAAIAPNVFRLHDPNGAIHDCRQFHEAKRSESSSRGMNGHDSTLRRLNNWMQRWSVDLPGDAADELESIIDDLARK